MKKSIYTIAISLLVLSFTSCKKNLEDALVGTWNVAQVKSEPAGGSTTTVDDAGTITFVSGGTGSYNITYPVLGNSQGDMTWSAADNNKTVIINGGLFSVVSGQYTVLTNKPKEQVWQQLNTNGDKYTYTLKK